MDSYIFYVFNKFKYNLKRMIHLYIMNYTIKVFAQRDVIPRCDYSLYNDPLATHND